MKRDPYPNAPADESAAMLTTALVLTVFGILAGIEAISWVITSALFILAPVACICGLVLRSPNENSRCRLIRRR